MIQLTGLQLRQLSEVVRSLWSLGTTTSAPLVLFQAGEQGLTVSCQVDDAAVAYRQSGNCEEQTFALSADLLCQIAADDNAAVVFESVGPRRCLAEWTQEGQPHRAALVTGPFGHVPAFPREPSYLITLLPVQLRALHQAMLTASNREPEWSRVELRGSGSVVACDGHQFLMQRGFAFPWLTDLQVSRTLLFGIPVLQQPWMAVGRTADRVFFASPGWKIALAIKQESCQPSDESPLAPPMKHPVWWRLSESNLATLRRYLPELSETSLPDAPVTLRLRETISLQTGTSTTWLAGRATSLLPPGIEPVQIRFSRRHLLRAFELGFEELAIHSDGMIHCEDQGRLYAWKPLETDMPSSTKPVGNPSGRAAAPLPINGFPCEAVLARNPRSGVVSVFVVRHSTDPHVQRFETFIKTAGLLHPEQQQDELRRLAEEANTDYPTLHQQYLNWADACLQFSDAPNGEQASIVRYADSLAYNYELFQHQLQQQERRRPVPDWREQRRAEAEQRRQQREEAERLWATDIVFLGRGVSDWLDDRTSDAERLTAAGLPLLSTPAELATALGVTISQLRWLAYHAEVTKRVHYVSFTVPKKSGGKRTLHAPLHLIGRVQRWILLNILDRLPTEDPCHGFRSGRSIVSNAAVHAGRAVVINMDLQSFFPSIGFRRVRSHFRRLGYSPAVASILALLCTASPRRVQEISGQRFYIATGPRGLPQGACTSPALSNQVARRLDRRLAGLARRLGASYTRYADDLSFSGDEPLLERIGYLMAKVRQVVQAEGFVVNEKKTRVQRRHSAQVVTGLVVNDRPGVLRREVRRLRAILHRARTEGLEKQNRDGRPNFLAWLHGMIGYVSMARPGAGARLQAELRALLAKEAAPSGV